MSLAPGCATHLNRHKAKIQLQNKMDDNRCRKLVEAAVREPRIARLISTLAPPRSLTAPSPSLSPSPSPFAPSPSSSSGNLNQDQGDRDEWEGISIDCRKCSDSGIEGSARAFLEINPLGLTICSNRVLSQEDVEESLRHELVHAFDYTRRRYDLTTCEGLAASEVRAARESECSADKGFMLPYMRERCIQTKAAIATSNIFPSTGSQCVAAVLKIALADTAPFVASSSSSSSSSKCPIKL